MDMYELLDKLGLLKFFPGKLNRTVLFSANRYGKKMVGMEYSNDYSKECVQKYINGIIHFDGNCRFYIEPEQRISKSFKEKRRANVRHENAYFPIVHPLDVSTAVFLCCDNVARQDLVLHCFGCKHAFPIVIKDEQLEPPKLFIWPMRGLFYSSDLIAKPVLSYVTKTISVLRFNNQDASKSNLINMVISKSEKVHSAFFHRDCVGSSKRKSQICTGMIEALPVLDAKQGPLLYLNLRGNCFSHRDQTRFLVMVSDVIILLCNTDETEHLRDLVNNHSNSNYKMLVIVFTDLDADDDNDTLHLKIESLSNTLAVNNYVIAYKNLANPDFIAELWYILKEIKATCTEDKLMLCAKSNHFEVDLDSMNKTLEVAKSFADRTVKIFTQNNQLFPLQGNVSLQWSKADFEIYRLKNWESNKTDMMEKLGKYRDELEVKKTKLRSKQLKMIQNNETFIIKEFIQTMILIQDEEYLDLAAFLQALKLHFDSSTRSNLKPLHCKYMSLMYQHRLEKAHSKHTEEQLEKIEESFNSCYLSLTIFLREMGEMFETFVAQRSFENIPNHLSIETLTKSAASLLINGYEIELMDGRTHNVPVKWIQGIILALHEILKNVRIKVITVLGVQSSGKSTLLNTMFGSQFAISSGRCTHGANIHLVRVSPEVSDEYLVDFLIIMDTEGLFSTTVKLINDERKQEERELATFVIGLSHVTIINIIGENISYLRDILPLSVHAFLRMELAGLNTKCVLLRHSVDKTKKDQLLRENYIMENELDLCTAAACDLERVEKRRFKDIIRFDITADGYFFPPLFEYSSDFEICSPSYSKAAVQLKQELLADREATCTLMDLHSHLGYLWSAIKRDNFVYEFKNIIEMEAQAVMDKRIWRLQWHIRRELQENASSFKHQVANCCSIKDLSQIESNFNAHTRKVVKEQQQKNHEVLCVGVRNSLLSKAIVRLRDSSFRKLQSTIEECSSICKAQFERDLSYRKTEVKILENDELVLNEISDFIKMNLPSDKKMEDDLKNIPDMLFRNWCNTLWTNKVYTQHFEFQEDAVSCIYSIFFAHRAKVDNILQKKNITDKTIDDFLREMSRNWALHSAFNYNGQIEMAQEIVRDCLNYVERLLKQIKSMKLFYHADIFKDIALEVRNHRYLYQGDILIKPSFEIELSIALCAELIKGLQAFETNNNLVSERLMQNTECHFKRTCREKIEYFTNITEAVEAFTSILTKELSTSLLNQLPREIVIYLKTEHPFIASKQTLLCHVWLALLDQRELLHIYLNSPVKAVEICVKQIFDAAVLTKEDKMRDLIVKCVDRHLKIISERLLEANVILENVTEQSKSNSMQSCVDVICSSLDGLLTLSNVKVLANDKINDTNAVMIVSRIIENLNEPEVNSTLTKQIQQLFLHSQYDVIRHETVREVLENLLGCKSICPFCGVLCCLGQEGHEGEHKALMHKPVGFQRTISGESTKSEIKTCWDECEMHRSSESSLPLVMHGWLIPSDVSVEDNSFWKFMFASFIDEIASARGQEMADIPASWKTLTKNAEINKLEKTMARINDL